MIQVSHPTDRANFSVVTVGALTLWFSYQTCIGFRVDGSEPVASENLWGPTTGKHLNGIGVGPAFRLPREEFTARLSAAVNECQRLDVS